MASAIVTSTYRYKRPPRKKKAGRPAADCMSGTESDHLRSVRQGPHAQRGAHEAERYAELLTGIEGASSRPVRRIVLMSMAVLAAGLLLAGTGGRAEAAFTFTFQEQGADVVATGSGSIDLAGLFRAGEVGLRDSGVNAQNATAGVAGTVAVYAGIMGPGGFGPGGHVASRGGGDAVAVNGSDGFLGVPPAYVSGSILANSMEFAGQTFASIGLTPGTYTWTWGSGVNADSLTVQIGPAAIPEPASVLGVGLGLLGLAAVRPLVVARRGSCASPATAAARTAWSSETRTPHRDLLLIRDLLNRMCHDGCGGRAGKVELLTGIEGASSRPVRRRIDLDQ